MKRFEVFKEDFYIEKAKRDENCPQIIPGSLIAGIMSPFELKCE